MKISNTFILEIPLIIILDFYIANVTSPCKLQHKSSPLCNALSKQEIVLRITILNTFLSVLTTLSSKFNLNSHYDIIIENL